MICRRTKLEITVEKVREWMDQGKAFELLDVRRDDERAIANLGGHHIPLDELEGRFNELDPTRRPWVIYCHHGVRSMYATQFLKLYGFDALSLRGGIDAWSASIDPTVPRY